MRKTNEEFMAEVMLRSAAYRRHRRQKLTAAAGTLCLMLAVGIGTVLFLHKDPQNLLRDGNQAHNLAAEYSEYEDCVSSAAPAESAADCASYSDSCQTPPDHQFTHEPQITDADSSASDQIQADESSAAPDEPAFLPGDFREMPDADLFLYYGIDGLPEQLGNSIKEMPVFRLTDSAEAGFRHGLSFAEEDAETIVNDANTWVYRNDETGDRFFVTVSRHRFPEEYTAVPDSSLYACRLTTGELYILIESELGEQQFIHGRYAKELHRYLTS